MYAQFPQPIVERCAKIAALDYLGCDGRPWGLDDECRTEDENKVLIGQAERFISAARANGKGGLILIENHNMTSECFDLMDRRMPEVLALGAEQVIYYYYPRDVDEPDRQMTMLARHLKTLSPQ